MAGIYIPGETIPQNCMSCNERDAEYGGACMLMPRFEADTYEEQYAQCPKVKLFKNAVLLSDHGCLKDADAIMRNLQKMIPYSYKNSVWVGRGIKRAAAVVRDMETIIPPDKEEI